MHRNVPLSLSALNSHTCTVYRVLTCTYITLKVPFAAQYGQCQLAASLGICTSTYTHTNKKDGSQIYLLLPGIPTTFFLL